MFHATRTCLRIVRLVATVAFAAATVASAAPGLAKDQRSSGVAYSFKRMPDGKEWLTQNLNVNADGSFCYDDSEANCARFGRLYTWASAAQACRSLGQQWRLPTNDEWQQLAKHHGGLMEESDEGGKATYRALMTGGASGFNGVLGGGRVPAEEQYGRLDAHGLYWTASESDATTAWFYNFGKGGASLNRHRGGNKQMAISVRCVRE
jgi:uncharacterized protein (TIGR02145 family)